MVQLSLMSVDSSTCSEKPSTSSTSSKIAQDGGTIAVAATSHQVGGNHYASMKIQPIQYIQANELGYHEGNVIKYVSRWRNKNGIEDLKKAKHYIELLIEHEQQKDK